MYGRVSLPRRVLTSHLASRGTASGKEFLRMSGTPHNTKLFLFNPFRSYSKQNYAGGPGIIEQETQKLTGTGRRETEGMNLSGLGQMIRSGQVKAGERVRSFVASRGRWCSPQSKQASGDTRPRAGYRPRHRPSLTRGLTHQLLRLRLPLSLQVALALSLQELLLPSCASLMDFGV